MQDSEMQRALAAALGAVNFVGVRDAIDRHPILCDPAAADFMYALADRQHSMAERLRLQTLAAFVDLETGIILQAYASSGDDHRNEIALQRLGRAKDHLKRHSHAAAWGLTQSNLGNAYVRRLQGDRAQNIEHAIACFEAALSVVTIERDPFSWAAIQNSLGAAYANRLSGTLADNIDQAIACLEAALQVRTRESSVLQWATTQNNLAAAYLSRISGDRNDNVENSITCAQAALTVYTRTSHPNEWANTLANLGNAYLQRSRGGAPDNIEEAIACYTDAIGTLTRDDQASLRATLQSNLGAAYVDRKRGNRVENLERAIALCEAALVVRTQDADPQGWADTQTNLGNAYWSRLLGDRAENLERSISYFSEALTVRSRRTDVYGWATILNNLGNAYRVRLCGNKADNIDQAIKYFKETLSVYTKETNPYQWAKTVSNLGGAYLEHLYGSRADNIEEGIAHLDAALSELTSESDPDAWAMIMANLGLAYAARMEGDAALNIEKAIACNEASLAVRSRESNPMGWIDSQLNLGRAYEARFPPHHSRNMERAVASYRAALQEGAWALAPHSVIRLHCSIARLLFRLGRDRWSEAWNELRKAEATFAERSSEAVSAEARRELLQARSVVGRWSAFIAVKQDNVGLGLATLEANRCFGLQEAFSIELLLSSDIEQELRDAIITARREITTLRAEAALSATAPGGRPYPTIVATLRNASIRLKQICASIERKSEPIEVNHILKVIPEDCTLIVPIATEFGGCIFVIPSGTTEVNQSHVLDCPSLNMETVRSQLWAWLKPYVAMMEGYAAESGASGIDPQPGGVATHQNQERDISDLKSTTSAALEDVLSWLWHFIMGPVVKRRAELLSLSGSRSSVGLPRLLLIPTGDFAMLPLHAAWREQCGTMRAVIDDFVCMYTASAHSAMQAQRRRAKASATSRPDRLLAAIDPTGDLAGSQRIELSGLARLFQGRESAILVGSKATKASFKELASGCPYVHLSCHGHFDWAVPEQSGLLMAGREWLTLPEIVADLDLADCRWLMLAACETGMTDVATAPEETVGQVAAFQQAGAIDVTATFWSIPDASSALFVVRAYENHLVRGLSQAEATREAAVWLRQLSYTEAAALLRSYGKPHAVRHGVLTIAEPAHEAGTKAYPFRSPLFWAPFATWG